MKTVMFSMCVLLSVLAIPSTASATIIGSGDIVSDTNDGGTVDVVDGNKAQTLSASLAGQEYKATLFSYQVTGTGVGTLQPFLAIADGATFKPIAVGSAVTTSGNTAAFADYSFGGSDTFTLSADTTVYAGFYFSAANCPIGFLAGGVPAALWTAGNDPAPVVGVDLPTPPSYSVSHPPALARQYDFSITATTQSVPEPGALVLLATGLLGLLAYAWRKRR